MGIYTSFIDIILVTECCRSIFFSPLFLHLTPSNLAHMNLQGAFAIRIEIQDYDYFNNHDYVDDFSIGIDSLLPGDWTTFETYEGNRGSITTATQMTMRFRVTCDDNWYGSDCNTECVPEAGRYTCDSNGGIVCESGWTGSSCTTGMCVCGGGGALVV